MITIDNREISSDNKPYIVAELSANHNGSIERAMESIYEAKKSGADAVKIQSYTADTMTIDCSKDDFLIKEGLWKGYKLYDLYSQAYTPYEWHLPLFKYAKGIGITIFSSPFDESAVDLLESLNTPAYKIASFEILDLPLIEYISKKGKPVLMSTGMASIEEIDEAVKTAKDFGCNELLIFHCVSSYPAPVEQTNLNNILSLKKRYGVDIGLSDHTIGNLVSNSAVTLGACAIEKHFTLSRKEKGPDSSFSMEPAELKELVHSTSLVWSAMGKGEFTRSKSELKSKVFRRSLYFVNNLSRGDTVQPGDIKRIRPGYGISPKFYNEIIGMRVNTAVERGDSVQWKVLEK